ncbi:hypothetical protein BKA93DRAFT_472118 [Sparassis latifolia]
MTATDTCDTDSLGLGLSRNDASSTARVPIDRIPEDVMHVIFESWRNDAPHEQFYTALCVASVSRSWRHVALNTSSLWTSLVLVLDGLRSPNPLPLFLERSCNRQLTLVVRRKEEVDRTLTDMHALTTLACDVMKLLVEHLEAWWSITISADIVDLARKCLPSLQWQGCARSLRHLVIVDPINSLDISPYPLLPLISSNFRAPQLCTLELRSTLEFMADLDLGTFPTLEKVLATDDSLPFGREASDFMKRFHSLRLLTCIHLIGSQFELTLQTHVEKVELQSLKELTFEDMPLEEVVTLLAIIHAPVLSAIRCINLDVYQSYPLIDQDDLAYFPSSPSLTLSKLSSGVKIEVFGEIAYPFEVVHFVGCGGRLDELIRVTSRGSPGTYGNFPRMVRLDIQSEAGVSLRWLRHMVEVRQGASKVSPIHTSFESPSAIEEIRVQTLREIPQEDRDWFERNLQVFEWVTDDVVDVRLDGSVTIFCRF